MRTPLAWSNLAQDRLRTLVATTGVAFALTLVFMQLGFLGSVFNTATLMADQLDFDVAIVARNYQYLGDGETFPLLRLSEARSVPGVARAVPFYVGTQVWRSEIRAPNPPGATAAAKLTADGVKHRAMLVYGFPVAESPIRTDPGTRAFPIRVAAADLDRLRAADSLLLDAKSHSSFRPREPGESVEVGGRRLRIAGRYELGTSFASDGSILVGDQTFARLFPGMGLDRVSLGLVTLDPEHAGRPEELARQVGAALTRADEQAKLAREDVLVLTREELGRREANYWVTQKSIGLIFLVGVAVSLVVGLVVVFQVLSSDIMDHAPEYATLKAMGYPNRYLAGVVVRQALLLSVFGYVPALAAGLLIHAAIWRWAGLPIAMTATRALLVLALSATMCVVAALLSVRKVTSSDPASLF